VIIGTVMNPVVIKKYRSETELQRDAAEATQAGYRVVAVTEQAGGVSAAGVVWLIAALGCFFVAWFSYWPLAVLGFVALLLAMTGRQKHWVATYQFAGSPSWGGY
jgi:hypothetical protein